MSTLEYKLHPLVVMNISDHLTRLRCGAAERVAESTGRVIGCLLGTQNRRVIDIANSYEVLYSVSDDGMILLDLEFLATKKEQYKAVFKSMEIMGWYSSGENPTPEIDAAIHKQIMEHNENPLYLFFNSSIDVTSSDLPIQLFESVWHVVDNVPTMSFSPVSYTVETEEAERIAVDDATRPQTGGPGTSQITAQLGGVQSAVKMLIERIKVLNETMKDIEAGRIPFDHAFVRQVAVLVNQLPVINSEQFHEEFMSEFNDSLLVTQLATMTKGCNMVNELAEKFSTVYEKYGSRRRGRL